MLALVGTAVAVTQVERRGGSDEPEAGAAAARLRAEQPLRVLEGRAARVRRPPAAGEGSGGFQAAWLRERQFREPVRDAHSLYLETAAELGLVGLALLLALLGGRRRRGRRAGPALAGAVAALAAFALHAGIDWDWELPALTLVALALAGLVLATSPAGARAPDGRAP